MSEARRSDARLPLAFWLILAAGALLRVAAFDAYSAHHPDESIQYLEQAHRIVFGYGVVPWEVRYGIRGALIPWLLAGPMQLGEWLAPGGSLYLVLPRALVAALNSTTMVAAWFIGARTSRSAAIVAMGVVAIWVESVFFSVQVLSESMALAAFLGAAALWVPGARFGRVVGAGALLALAGLLRFQFAPAIVAFVLVMARTDWLTWKRLLIGGLPVLAAGAIVDLGMGLSPYAWVIDNVRLNLGEGRMMRFGASGPLYYVAALARYWQIAAFPILGAAIFAGPRYRPLLVAAVVNLLFHQLIGHREYRFIWLSVQVVLILAAIGSVNLAKGSKFARRIHPVAVVAGLLAVWSAASALLATGEVYRTWRVDGGTSRLAAVAAREPSVCGIAANRFRNVEFGYVYVHRALPVYLLRPVGEPSQSVPGASGAAFNAAIVDRGMAPPAGFSRVGCGDEGERRSCLYTRPGGCTPNAASAALEHQNLLLRQDR